MKKINKPQTEDQEVTVIPYLTDCYLEEAPKLVVITPKFVIVKIVTYLELNDRFLMKRIQGKFKLLSQCQINHDQHFISFQVTSLQCKGSIFLSKMK